MVSAHLYFGLGTRVVRVMMSLTFTLYERISPQVDRVLASEGFYGTYSCLHALGP